jgi:hypothetical protein
MCEESKRLYSGDKSKPFWDRVNRIPWSQGGEAIYILGCELQEFEGRVLAKLEEMEQKRPSTRPGREGRDMLGVRR